MKLPQGFRAAGVRAGIKPSGNPDLSLVVGDAELQWALSATRNRVRAPCVTRNVSLLEGARPIRALVVNAGNANAATGAQGVRDNETLAELAAAALGVQATEVLTASTGVIGVPLPLDRLRAGVPTAALALEETAESLSEAIMTTDLVRKVAEVTLSSGARIVGVAKGSGMIHPNMATMFAFVMTDARIAQPRLRALWGRLVDDTFNQISVDGDTSTNDMAIVLSSGLLETPEEEIEAGLEQVARELAQAIARDGEGASTLITAVVRGAADGEEARRASRAIISSSLVKAAVHGRDPNWGRILSAVGQSEVAVDLDRVRVVLQGTIVYQGGSIAFDAPSISEAMRSPDVLIEVDLGVGEAEGRAWGCDLSANYVMINALYTT
jgi:glutamate N-acetyltransferase/amino-acid N-acetyltransferase